MNKQKLLNCRDYRVRLWPIAGRKVPNGPWLPQIDDDWIVRSVDPRGIVELSNIRTGHIATLGHDRIHHFEFEPHRDWDGLKHGMFILNTQLVLSGCNVFYSPRAHRAVH